MFLRIFLSNLLICLELVVLISSQLIPYRTKQIFNYENDVVLNSIKYSSKPFGYKTESTLTVESVWNSSDIQILHFELDNFKLSTKSVSNNDINEFESQKMSSISQYSRKQDFYLILENHIITKLFLKPSNDISMTNLQRGIASLFQFHFVDGVTFEKDALDNCEVHYHAHTSSKYTKVKNYCRNWFLIMRMRRDLPLDVRVNSIQEIDYSLSQEQSLNKLHSIEKHSIYLPIKTDAGSQVESVMQLKHLTSSYDVEQMKGDTLKDILDYLIDYKEVDIESEIDGNVNMEKGKLKTLVKSLQSKLTEDKIGTEELGQTFLKLLPVARITNKNEFIQILKARSTQKIRYSLLDLLAATKTEDSHLAVTEVLQIDNDEHFDQLERYLQSLSVGTGPQLSVIQDLYKRLTKKSIKNVKLLDTLLQTVAACSEKYAKLSPKRYNEPIIKAFRSLIFSKLESCDTTDCKNIYIRALQNLRDPSTISNLLEIILKNENTLNSVAAMKALKVFQPEDFDDQARADLEKIFYQTSKKFDSTVRTLALDKILGINPSKQVLRKLVLYLSSNDKAFEIKTYVIQKLKMISEIDPIFSSVFLEVLREIPKVNNYHVMAQKGLTTALFRTLTTYPSFNQTLYSFQESYKGILKQGTVDIKIGIEREETSVFSLGLYTRGLSSFVGDSSSNNIEEAEEEENEESESPSAGMEIAVQGVQFRPLVFFSSQSELMGHVWSGTASDPTPAYQATVLLQDHEEYLLLQNGVTLHARFFGVQSIDLNGQVTFSLWNRNAHTEINQNTALVIDGSITIATPFIKEQNEFLILTEPKINLIADCDFYLDVMMCLQLNRPEMYVQHYMYKKEQIFGENSIRKNTLRTKNKLPGNTLALNRKNNQMCNKIFPQDTN